LNLELKAAETLLLLELVLDSLGEKEEKEIGLRWVLIVGVGFELRKVNHGDSAAEMASGFVARNSIIVTKIPTNCAEEEYCYYWYLAA
jgi:hypothetical protein